MTNIKDKFASLTTSLEIPLSKIHDVTTEPVKIDNWRTVKMFATQLPSYYAGRFYHIGSGRKFFLFSNKNSCITLRMEGFRYKEIIVEVAHKEQVAKTLYGMWGKNERVRLEDNKQPVTRPLGAL